MIIFSLKESGSSHVVCMSLTHIQETIGFETAASSIKKSA